CLVVAGKKWERCWKIVGMVEWSGEWRRGLSEEWREFWVFQSCSQEISGDLTTRDHLSPKVKVFLIPVIGRFLIEVLLKDLGVWFSDKQGLLIRGMSFRFCGHLDEAGGRQGIGVKRILSTANIRLNAARILYAANATLMMPMEFSVANRD
nr:hypothetical protein [Tanacetum cinerariifolium]